MFEEDFIINENVCRQKKAKKPNPKINMASMRKLHETFTEVNNWKSAMSSLVVVFFFVKQSRFIYFLESQFHAWCSWWFISFKILRSSGCRLSFHELSFDSTVSRPMTRNDLATYDRKRWTWSGWTREIIVRIGVSTSIYSTVARRAICI